MKRTRDEIKMANELCTNWLKYYENNPDLAYGGFLKNYIELGLNLPYYLDGLSDFVRVSKLNSHNVNFICIQRKFDLLEVV